ncbi:MAG: hypothetical protein OXG33_06145 [Chloroflexi bacterium]|nr:hypothetical protein [Chloroflexota bacterium]
MRRANHSPAPRMTEWTGRLLLVGAVVFWWGGHVGPQLFSFAFPALLSPDALPPQLNPEQDGSLANLVSAVALVMAALLALANAIVCRRKAAGRLAVSGWSLLGLTAAYLAWEEVSDFHATDLDPIGRTIFGGEFLGSAGTQLWVFILSPLILGFLVAMGLFACRELRAQAVRGPFILGLIAWLVAIAQEAGYWAFASGRASELVIVVEETLEFSGALLIGLSAATALRGHNGSRMQSGRASRRWRVSLIGSATVVAVLGVLAIAFVFRALLIDARAPSHTDAFGLRLGAKESVVQEVHMPSYPLGRLDFRLAHRDPDRDSGIASLRVSRLDSPDQPLAEYQLTVPTGQDSRRIGVDLVPAIVEPEGQRLALELVADVEPDAELRVVATRVNRYDDGALWINGAPAFPDQDLEFAAYGAPEPTRSKLESVWKLFASGWSWPVLLADLWVGLTLVALTPVVLITGAFQSRRRP